MKKVNAILTGETYIPCIIDWAKRENEMEIGCSKGFPLLGVNQGSASFDTRFHSAAEVPNRGL